jgi:hypothetical protein
MVWQSTPRAPDTGLHELGYLSSEIIDAACDEAIEGVVMPGLESAGVV